jgi:hypothetical protein
MKIVSLAVAATFAAIAPAQADNSCVANGRYYRIGETACLKLPDGDQLALCSTVLNNTSWKKLRDGCPQDQIDEGQAMPPALQPAGAPDTRSEDGAVAPRE